MFASDFVATANARLAALPDGWDIVLWGWLFDSTLVYQVLPGQPAFLLHRERTPNADDFAAASQGPASPQLFRLNRACGTMGYTISPQGAARLLAHCTPLRPLRLYAPEVATAWPVGGIDMMMSVFYPQLQAYVSVPPLAMSQNVNSTTRLVVSAGLCDRVSRLSLPSLVTELDEIGATPSTEVELYRSWIMANGSSNLVFAAFFNMANALARAGDYPNAFIGFQHVLALRPDFEPASAALAVMWRRSADLGREPPA
jgi:hypothetical protein